MSHSFIGGYFLDPYLSRFETAVNEAATRIQEEQSRDASDAQAQGPRKPYTLIKAHNVGYTAIILLARDPASVRDLQLAEVGFGAADLGNKGAVGLRILYEAGHGKSTELTFVATHLAAMEWNLPKRNANWAAIMRGLTFEDPEAVVERFRAVEEASDDREAGERTRLLPDEHHGQHLRLQRQLHNISVFKPSSHLFVAGDLNYRISTTAPPANAAFPSLDPASENYYPSFIGLDQLTREKKAGRTLHGLNEAEIKFPPTYKYDIKPGKGDDEEQIEWSFAPHRYPSWTDRVLYLDVPSWLGKKKPSMNVLAYDAMPITRSSDHRAVYLRVEVPLLSPEEMAPPLALEDTEESADPRVRLPVEIDPEAWGRRAAARKKEAMAGWSMFLWSTKQGAAILATVLVVGAGAYWWRQSH